MLESITISSNREENLTVASETIAAKKKRARDIVRRLRKAIPDHRIALCFKNPLELLVATILSAQCTDQRVNMVTPALFKKYKTAADYAKADPAVFENEIRSTGFYKAKARSILGCAKVLTERFSGKVPAGMEELVALPGVGRKTANVVLGNAFKIPGIAVDTHVKRVAFCLGLTGNTDPEKIELDLNEIIPEKDWTEFSHLVIWHGRLTCFARKPNCKGCAVNAHCPSRGDV